MELLSVNVARPRGIIYRGRPVQTGIFKEPVQGRTMLRTLNLDGDGQADLKNHGGPYRSVYVYTHENYEHWRATLGELPFGSFGENFTVMGMPEDQVCIGDTFRVGEAVVQVTQPRPPCFKLGVRVGNAAFPNMMLDSGRVGFYLRVLQEGTVGAGDTIEKLESDELCLTVKQVIHLRFFDSENREAAGKAANLTSLTTHWRDIFTERAAP